MSVSSLKLENLRRGSANCSALQCNRVCFDIPCQKVRVYSTQYLHITNQVRGRPCPGEDVSIQLRSGVRSGVPAAELAMLYIHHNQVEPGFIGALNTEHHHSHVSYLLCFASSAPNICQKFNEDLIYYGKLLGFANINFWTLKKQFVSTNTWHVIFDCLVRRAVEGCYVSFFFSESEESDYDNQFVGWAVLARLQADVGPRGVRGSEESPRPCRPHLEARHRPLQQVRSDLNTVVLEVWDSKL